MKWIEVKITTRTGNTDEICILLMSIGIYQVQIIDKQEMKEFLNSSKETWDYLDETLINKEDLNSYVIFYLSDDLEGEEHLKAIQGYINSNDIYKDIELNINCVDDADWLNNWKKDYKPIEIGNRVVIKPSWENYDNEQKVIFNIDPGLAFGTGLHATTRLCIENIEKYANKDTEILDIGCGTGILSIVGLLLGCKNATAIDIDHIVKDVVKKNLELNNINEDICKLLIGSLLTDIELQEEVSKKKYNLILSNIVSDIIIEHLKIIKSVIKDTGIFIASGVIEERETEVVTALKEEGFKVENIQREEGWVSIVSKKREAYNA